ncbi:MAG: sigma-70 family RNA polymerase sigma factor [Cyclobacteriaceae bacterium]
MNTQKLSLFPSNESLLWDQFRQGDEQAYLTIYNQYADVLFRYGIKFTSNREQVLDCIHDLFVELWERRTHLGATSSIKYYLFRSLRRNIAKLDNDDRLSSIPEDSLYAEPQNFEWVVEEARAEQQRQIREAVQSLPKRQKEVIYLRFFNNFTFEEAASIMGIDLRSAYNHTYKGLAALRKKLSRQDVLTLSSLSLLVLYLLGSML